MANVTIIPINRINKITGVRIFQRGQSPTVTHTAPMINEPVAIGMAAG